MSSERKLEIIIDPMGNTTINAIGFHGQGCKQASQAIEQALAAGAGEFEVVKKPEWHETEDETTVHETHQGW